MFTANDEDEDKDYIRMVDYKSSTHSFHINNALRGINIQMLLYLFAMLDANPSLSAGGVTYFPAKNSGALDEENSPLKLLAINHNQSGLYIKDENTEKDLNNYIDAVISKITEEDNKTHIMTADESTLSDAELKERREYSEYLANIRSILMPDDSCTVDASKFNDLRKDLEASISEKLSSLYNGDISATPQCHKEQIVNVKGKTSSKEKVPCEYCRYKNICNHTGAPVFPDNTSWKNPYI